MGRALDGLPSATPEAYRRFVACKRKTIKIESGPLDWLPDAEWLSEPPEISFEEAGKGVDATISLAFLSVGFGISLSRGRLQVDTSSIPTDAPVVGEELTKLADGVRSWVEDLNADMRESGQRIGELSLHDGALRMVKEDVAARGAPSPSRPGGKKTAAKKPATRRRKGDRPATEPAGAPSSPPDGWIRNDDGSWTPPPSTEWGEEDTRFGLERRQAGEEVRFPPDFGITEPAPRRPGKVAKAAVGVGAAVALASGAGLAAGVGNQEAMPEPVVGMGTIDTGFVQAPEGFDATPGQAEIDLRILPDGAEEDGERPVKGKGRVEVEIAEAGGLCAWLSFSDYDFSGFWDAQTGDGTGTVNHESGLERTQGECPPESDMRTLPPASFRFDVDTQTGMGEGEMTVDAENGVTTTFDVAFSRSTLAEIADPVTGGGLLELLLWIFLVLGGLVFLSAGTRILLQGAGGARTSPGDSGKRTITRDEYVKLVPPEQRGIVTEAEFEELVTRGMLAADAGSGAQGEEMAQQIEDRAGWVKSRIEAGNLRGEERLLSEELRDHLNDLASKVRTQDASGARDAGQACLAKDGQLRALTGR